MVSLFQAYSEKALRQSAKIKSAFAPMTSASLGYEFPSEPVMTGTFLYASLYLGQIGSRPVGTPRVPTMRSWRPMASRNSSEPWFMVTIFCGLA